jgi:hypothetical protein
MRVSRSLVMCGLCLVLIACSRAPEFQPVPLRADERARLGCLELIIDFGARREQTAHRLPLELDSLALAARIPPDSLRDRVAIARRLVDTSPPGGDVLADRQMLWIATAPDSLVLEFLWGRGSAGWHIRLAGRGDTLTGMLQADAGHGRAEQEYPAVAVRRQCTATRSPAA